MKATYHNVKHGTISDEILPHGTLRTLNLHLLGLFWAPIPSTYLFTWGGQFVRVHGQAFQIFRYGLQVSDFPQHWDFFFLKVIYNLLLCMIHFIIWIQLFFLGTLSILSAFQKRSTGTDTSVLKPFTSPFFREMENKKSAITTERPVSSTANTRAFLEVSGGRHPCWGKGGRSACGWDPAAQPPPQAKACPPPPPGSQLASADNTIWGYSGPDLTDRSDCTCVFIGG